MNIRRSGNLIYNFYFNDVNSPDYLIGGNFDINIYIKDIQVSKLNVMSYQVYSSSTVDLHLRHDDYGPDFVWRHTDPGTVKTIYDDNKGKRPTITNLRKKLLFPVVGGKLTIDRFNKAFTTIATERGLMWTI